MKVCVIDNAADQRISGIVTTATPVTTFSEVITSSGTINATSTSITGVTTAGITTGLFVRSNISGVFAENTTVTGITSTSGGFGTLTISPASINSVNVSLTVRFGTQTTSLSGSALQVGYGVTQALQSVQYATAEGTVETFNGYLRGFITGIGNSYIDIKVAHRVSNAGIVSASDYSRSSALASFDSPITTPIVVSTSSGVSTATVSSGTISDWYDQQTLGLDNNTIYWNSIAQKPGTSQYASERNSKNDEVHVVVVDDLGLVTGTSGNIIEKYVGLSKASDGIKSPSQDNYYKSVISGFSAYVYPGAAETGTATKLVLNSGSTTAFTYTTGTWNSTAQNTYFNVIGSKTYELTGGADYSGPSNIGGYSVSLADIVSGYNIFKNSSEYNIDFLINGPSGGSTIYESQAKANALIAIANERRDCIAVISPHKGDVVNVSNTTTQTENIIKFFEGLTSSSYAVFDSGYKYMFNRFNDDFDYIACNADIAGLMARTAINNYSWFSPAGTARGAINNAVKLAYNPNQAQRDAIYSKRINPIISSPGAGIILYGDKTAQGFASAFDRINVRRLFLTLERTIESAARDQLFEFNDIITRTNFVNIVDPFLSDVQSKRGISDYVLVCDETNNTPDVIDANEFKADIFVQPARSINYIGLTFVATRTGISFSEVIGSV